MRTPGQSKKDRKELHKQIARELRIQARAKLVELKAQIKAARERRRELHAKAKHQCKAGRKLARQRAKERRERAIAELRAARLAERDAARSSCEILKDTARQSLEAHHKARALHQAERQYQQELRRIEAGNRAKMKAQRRSVSGKERRQERDDEVRANLDPEMLALWDRVKGSIRGCERRSRTEAFLDYAHENPGELLGAIDDVAEERIRQLEAEAKEAHRATKRKRYTPEELASVPF